MTSAEAATTATAVSHRDMANAIRALAMDAVEQANSGHPGMPMGMADIATVLFSHFLKFDPADPKWPDRDRFVLSNGHGSMLLYAVLYLTGYPDIDLDQIRNFRQLGSRTAGHPEYGHAAGIETTTGPLGQGLANAVGMAIAERMLAARFGDGLVDHYTYVFAGDGCLMEGISHEAISLAGHLQLGKLIVLFDQNEVSIDGPTDLTVSDDQLMRFRAAGWHVQSIDGHDAEAIAEAIREARDAPQPSLIACRTIIGYGAPKKQGTASTHGAPLGKEEVAATRKAIGWSHEPFVIPDALLDAWRATGARGAEDRRNWQRRLDSAEAKTRKAFLSALGGELPAGWENAVREFKRRAAEKQSKVATRQASGDVLEVLSDPIPSLVGGSADLTGSNVTRTSRMQPITRSDFSGRYIYYGVREHGMAAAMNGIALHGGFVPYGGTFLIFTDYCRPAIRLSALMRQRVIYVMTHDSIGLGEDGPTHQPVEQLASLRAIPNLQVLRPCDAVETAECWAIALASTSSPSVIALTRQGVPTLRTDHTDENLAARGAYVLAEAEGERQVTLIATGSEVSIAMTARDLLRQNGIAAAVVSAPCLSLFDGQDADYRRAVLRPDTVRVAVEAACRLGWERYIGENGAFVGMSGFGASAPADQLYRHFGITPEAVAEAARSRL